MNGVNKDKPEVFSVQSYFNQLYRGLCYSRLSLDRRGSAVISREFKHVYNELFNSFMSYLLLVKDVTNVAVQSEARLAGDIMALSMRYSHRLDTAFNGLLLDYLKDLGNIRSSVANHNCRPGSNPVFDSPHTELSLQGILDQRLGKREDGLDWSMPVPLQKRIKEEEIEELSTAQEKLPIIPELADRQARDPKQQQIDRSRLLDSGGVSRGRHYAEKAARTADGRFLMTEKGRMPKLTEKKKTRVRKSKNRDGPFSLARAYSNRQRSRLRSVRDLRPTVHHQPKASNIDSGQKIQKRLGRPPKNHSLDPTTTPATGEVSQRQQPQQPPGKPPLSNSSNPKPPSLQATPKPKLPPKARLGTEPQTKLGSKQSTQPKKAQIVDMTEEKEMISLVKKMRESLEIADDGDFFPRSTVPEDEIINRVERVAQQDYVLCGFNYSIFYRKDSEVAPFYFTHQGEEMHGFYVVNDLWIWVCKLNGGYRLEFTKMVDVRNPVKKPSSELVTSCKIVVWKDRVFFLKTSGIYYLEASELGSSYDASDSLVEVNARQIFSCMNVTDFCIEEGCLFSVSSNQNRIMRVDLSKVKEGEVPNEKRKYCVTSSVLLEDEIINVSYIKEPKIKSLDGDMVINITCKLILANSAGQVTDQYPSGSNIDCVMFNSKGLKFVVSLHRREDITILLVHNHGFFVVSRLMCLEEDHQQFFGLLHIANNEILVYGSQNYHKKFTINV